MRAGQLDQLIVLQERVETTNAFGEVQWEYLDWKEAWAAVEYLQGREYFSAQQIQSDTALRIRIRYLTGVTAKMRIRHQPEPDEPIRYYDIQNILQPKDVRRRELHLMCLEHGADGFRTTGSTEVL